MAQYLTDLHLLAVEKHNSLLTVTVREGGIDRSRTCSDAFSHFLATSLELNATFRNTPEGEAYNELFKGVPVGSELSKTLMPEYVEQYGHQILESHLQQEINLYTSTIAECE